MSKIFEVNDVSPIITVGRGTTYRLINENMGAQKIGVMLIDLEPDMTATDIHYASKHASLLAKQFLGRVIAKEGLTYMYGESSRCIKERSIVVQANGGDG